MQYDTSTISFSWSDAGDAGYVLWWESRERERAKNPSVKVGRDCLVRVADYTWWNWDGGSTPFFWRWPEEFRSTIRDRAPLWFDFDQSPAFKRPQ
jgi:hypothetical protein